MMLILGIIIGLLIALIIVATSIYLQSRGKDPVKAFTQSLEAAVKPQGMIIKPKSDVQRATEAIIRRSKETGQDIYLADL